MYTYRHPYRPFEFTPSYIERRGQLSLFRAINVGRVIGFIGSGATAAYGRPTWSDLVETAVAAVKDSATLSKRREIKETECAVAIFRCDDLDHLVSPAIQSLKVFEQVVHEGRLCAESHDVDALVDDQALPEKHACLETNIQMRFQPRSKA